MAGGVVSSNPKVFSFIDPQDEEGANRNWRVLTEGTKFQTYTPVFTGVTTNGATPTQPNRTSMGGPIGVYQFYGPLVFVHWEWNLTLNWRMQAITTWTLPVPPAKPTAISPLPYRHTGTLLVQIGGNLVNPTFASYCQMSFATNTMFNYTAPPVSTNDDYSMDFWYFRS